MSNYGYKGFVLINDQLCPKSDVWSRRPGSYGPQQDYCSPQQDYCSPQQDYCSPQQDYCSPQDYCTKLRHVFRHYAPHGVFSWVNRGCIRYPTVFARVKDDGSKHAYGRDDIVVTDRLTIIELLDGTIIEDGVTYTFKNGAMHGIYDNKLYDMGALVKTGFKAFTVDDMASGAGLHYCDNLTDVFRHVLVECALSDCVYGIVRDDAPETTVHDKDRYVTSKLTLVSLLNGEVAGYNFKEGHMHGLCNGVRYTMSRPHSTPLDKAMYKLSRLSRANPTLMNELRQLVESGIDIRRHIDFWRLDSNDELLAALAIEVNSAIRDRDTDRDIERAH